MPRIRLASVDGVQWPVYLISTHLRIRASSDRACLPGRRRRHRTNGGCGRRRDGHVPGRRRATQAYEPFIHCAYLCGAPQRFAIVGRAPRYGLDTGEQNNSPRVARILPGISCLLFTVVDTCYQRRGGRLSETLPPPFSTACTTCRYLWRSAGTCNRTRCLRYTWRCARNRSAFSTRTAYSLTRACCLPVPTNRQLGLRDDGTLPVTGCTLARVRPPPT